MIKGYLISTLTGVAGVAIGACIGVFADKYHNVKNTPEAMLIKLEHAKAEADTAKNASIEAKKENDASYKKLVSTKKEYQKEVRDDIEREVRKELADYIDKADEKYEKARKENELAQLKLELSKKNFGSSYCAPNGVHISL